MPLTIVPIFQKEAFAFITKLHRHHRKPVGSVFQLAVSDGEKIVGVVVIGRPNGRPRPPVRNNSRIKKTDLKVFAFER